MFVTQITTLSGTTWRKKRKRGPRFNYRIKIKSYCICGRLFVALPMRPIANSFTFYYKMAFSKENSIFCDVTEKETLEMLKHSKQRKREKGERGGRR